MNRFLLTLILCFSFFSCSKKQTQQDNAKLILGDWHVEATPNNPDEKGLESNLPEFYSQGFTFYQNYTYDNKIGFYATTGDWKPDLYLGTLAKYKITSDSLSFYDLGRNKWDKYRLEKLSSDVLEIETGNRTIVFKHSKTNSNKNPQFDRIVLSTSDCLGPCPVTNTVIDAGGSVLFNGVRFATKQGFYNGSIPKQTYYQLQGNFQKLDLTLLQNEYRAAVTDMQTTSTTFVKNGKIYKSINDYGRTSPYLLQWAYVPLAYLYQTIPLQQVKKTDLVSVLDVLTETSFQLKKGDSFIDLNQSEIFLLFDYLMHGKVTNSSFKVRYLLHPSFENHSFYNIKTDGRYYTFVKDGKPITIDIGFNFYDVNEKIWEWKKVEQ